MNLFLQELHNLSSEGGWVFWGLLALAFGIAYSLLSIYRLLRFPAAPQPANLSWDELLKRQDLDEPTMKALEIVLVNEADAEETEHRLFSVLRRRLPFAFTIIGAAPLLGLLGTVSGMFATFRGLSQAAAQVPVDVISSGVSEALITTQTGLIIGVPSYIICSVLKIRTDRRHAAFRRLAAASRSRTCLHPDRSSEKLSPDEGPQPAAISYSHA